MNYYYVYILQSTVDKQFYTKAKLVFGIIFTRCLSLREFFSKQSVNYHPYLKDCFVIKNISRNDCRFCFPKTNLALVYTGYTKDINKRVAEHNSGKVKSTKERRPLKLIYWEGCLNQQDATRREKYLKTAWGKRYIKNRIKNYLTG